jgi:parallel beta-helix repeat protein
MNRNVGKKGLAVGIILLFIGSCIIPAIAQDVEKSSRPTLRGNWLYVGGSGPGNYTKIQDAIDNANNGDTVFVFNGTYYENIIIDKIIMLIGDNKNTTIIDGTNGNDSVITIKAGEVYIKGFTISNSSKYHCSIFFKPNHNGVSIIDNVFKYNNAAIVLQNSHNTNISGNTLLDTYGDGIILINSSNNTIDRNVIINNTGNNPPNSINIYANSNNNNIFSNTINQSFFGINIAFSANHNKISKNKIKNCEIGIYLTDVSSNEVSSNTISNNKWGVDLIWQANDNDINNNTISNNIYGIEISSSRSSINNTIYHNNFFNNTLHASITNGNNKWDNGYPSCGNYWDDYTGDDFFWGPNQDMNGSDGVGDTHRVIYGGTTNQDHYPLMHPYGITKLSITIQPKNFRLLLSIKNVGNTTAFNVQWNMTIDGFVLFGKDISGGLPKSLVSQEEIKVSSKYFIMGFGRIVVTATAWADNAHGVSARIHGILLLFFFIPIGKEI